MNQLRDRLLRSDWGFGLWAGLASFLAYFCMYLYRKPYAAGTFAEMTWGGLDYKLVLIIAQVIGYATSKFIGIKVISELRPERRIVLFLSLIILAWLALVGLAFSPPAWGPFWMLLNGLPLGMIWGIVFTYCEGRKLTEVLTVFLAANFILTSGLAKTLGRWILELGYTENTMPMLIGLGVFPLLLLALWMLSQIPPPSETELVRKAPRAPMDTKAKWRFLNQYWFAISLFVLVYLLLTIIRDIRDNFAVEIWLDLGYGENPAIFSTTELPVTICVLLGLGLLYRINDNQKALQSNIAICILGLALLLGSTLAFQMGYCTGLLWMIISGIGLFLPYILFNGIIFDRFIASFRIMGNVGFIMYLSDAIGYLGSIGIMLYKNFGESDLQWLSFYQRLCWWAGGIGIILLSLLLSYFYQSARQQLSTSAS